ncbi:hypothetical protein lerEdw1_018052 [Lerista edwardsae]|nr:hypothetical protein lerEdw1_018052 [Lerista edwardsae]
MSSGSSLSPKMKTADESRRQLPASRQTTFPPPLENVEDNHQQEWKEEVEVAASAVCPRLEPKARIFNGDQVEEGRESRLVEEEVAAQMHGQSLVPVVEPLENQKATNSDGRLDNWHGRKV